MKKTVVGARPMWWGEPQGGHPLVIWDPGRPQAA